MVIADLLGVPQDDRHNMFDWSNRMIGQEDPEFQSDAGGEEFAQTGRHGAVRLRRRALREEAPRTRTTDLMSVLTQVEVEGDKLSELELELFFLLLTVAGNETTRNLISGAMHAFFQNPDQWAQAAWPTGRSCPSATEEMLRFVTPGHELPAPDDRCRSRSGARRSGTTRRWSSSTSRPTATRTSSRTPTRFDITRSPNPHMAFGGGGPHFCLGANLARMEIRVMFEHLLDRMPDIRQDGEVQRLQSAFINGVKHLPVAFTPGPPVGADGRAAGPTRADRRRRRCASTRR